MFARNDILSLFFCITILCIFLFFVEGCLHWYVIPVFLCGVVIGRDAGDWIRGKLDVLDPVGILGVLGLHFFFLAPLLHVAWDYQMRYVVTPLDWRPWLGGMAFLNLFGLLIYQVTRRLVASRVSFTAATSYWMVSKGKIWMVLCITSLISLGLQIYIYAQSGGLSGYIMSYSERSVSGSAFDGMGGFFMLSETFPILMMLGFVVYAGRSDLGRSWGVLCFVLIIFLFLQLFFGGLRGSRSNTLWALFWAVGMIHLWVRPVSRKIIAFGVVFFFAFMYLYGFYKSVGADVLRVLGSSEARAQVALETGRSMEGLLLSDLGRSDVQALLLHNKLTDAVPFDYAWGRTYLAALTIFIPRGLWPERPPTKIMEGTEAIYGMGTYRPGLFRSSLVYGLAGEALLNFGPTGVPFSFIFLGIVVSFVRIGWTMLPRNDARLLLLPPLINLGFVVLGADSDIVLFYLVKNCAIPSLVLFLGVRRRTLSKKERYEYCAYRSIPSSQRWGKYAQGKVLAP